MENEEDSQSNNFMEILKNQMDQLDIEKDKEEKKPEESKGNVTPTGFQTPGGGSF